MGNLQCMSKAPLDIMLYLYIIEKTCNVITRKLFECVYYAPPLRPLWDVTGGPNCARVVVFLQLVEDFGIHLRTLWDLNFIA